MTIYYISPFLSCWSLIPYVCSEIESLLDLLLHCEPRWFRAGASQHQPQAILQSRIVCIILTSAMHRWRSAFCSPSPERLNDCRTGLQIDCFSFSLEVLLSKFSWGHLTGILPKLDDIGTGGFYLVCSLRSFHKCHGHKEVTDSVSVLRNLHLS